MHINLFFAHLKIAPRQLSKELWVFPSNSSCNGGTSWWLGCDPEPVLIDCPPLSKANIEFLKKVSKDRQARIILTSREGHGDIQELQNALGWPILIQEQEAYLLPEVLSLETFRNEHITVSGLRVLWTPGPTPGSCVVYSPSPRNVLFCGRLLIPINSKKLGIVRNRRTFHWTRSQKSLQKLLDWIPLNASPELASGAGLDAIAPRKTLPWECLLQTNQMIHL